jgi:LPXTG-site transpeptidase (sortase) family protein
MKTFSIARKIQLSAAVVFIIGLAIMLPINYYSLQNKAAAEQASAPIVLAPKPIGTPAVPLITGDPVAIDIPSLNINLQVVDGNYNAKTGQWNVSNTQAQFATPSTEPNNISGNTLIYGHYRPEVFAYLHLIKPGAQVTVTTNTGYIFTYTYTSTAAYDPSDTSIFAYQGAPRLTIQTCSGTFMQNRQMYYFTYDSYAKQ